jgi:hypothetical protein
MSQTKLAQEWEVGFRAEPLEFTVSAELNQQYAYAQEDYDPLYVGDGAIVHPALLLNMSNTTRSPSHALDQRSGNLHSRDETWFLRPARVGSPLRVDWTVVEWYERKGRPYRVTEAVVTEADGGKVLRRRIHTTWTQGS